MNNLNKKRISTIFMGTPDFAVPVLESLLEADYIEIKKVVTQPDKEVGRKKILTPTPIKVFSQKNGLVVLQPQKIKDKNFIEKLTKLKPDLIIVAAYGQIIPDDIINIPRCGCINIHASLLPRYRGASPIQTAILNGEVETGVTIMKIDGGLDTGDIISREKIEIKDSDTSETLHDKLSILGANLLIKTLPNYLSGKIKPISQNNKRATETKIIKREHGKVDFKNKNSKEIERQLRAFTPWPGVYTFFQNKKLKILKVKISEQINPLFPPGKIYKAMGVLAINCKKGSLILEKVQLEGKNEITGKEFINGYLK